MRLFAVAGWKYEPDFLVEQMKENLHWFNEICVVDTRHRKNEFWIHEGEYRLLQRKALEDAGIREGDWVYVTSPDERLEDRAESIIKNAIKKVTAPTIFRFRLREMWTPNEYRIDGIWGKKTRPRLYPYLPDQKFSNKRIQQPPTPIGEYNRVSLNLNIYHLKMINPRNRTARVKAYKKTDPEYKYLRRNNSAKWQRVDPQHKFLNQGYNYLLDESGIKLKRVSELRKFTPTYKNYELSQPD